jgi:three-Cys-motif partner protein
MALEFEKDAICLSGLTGSKLKCDVIGEYYPFWWRITSGGQTANYDYPTALIELDAATGEVYIQDTKETILGSSGHALELKCTNSDTKKLKVILVEKDHTCYTHLKSVIKRRWGTIDMDVAEGPLQSNHSNVYLMNMALDDALNTIEKLELGNALFFFDPLRSVDYGMIEEVARKRIDSYYKTGTEFIIFVFTSDWFLGRDDFASLPTTVNVATWSPEQKKTVFEADALFGTTEWRDRILNNNPLHERENDFIDLYQRVLRRWFRYVLPLPFNPKAKQVFHIILCSNYEIGIRATRDFYSEKTGNPKYLPDNRSAYKLFRDYHPEILTGLHGNERPLQWKVLWSTVKTHEDGICDFMCTDYIKIDHDKNTRQYVLDWLENHGYLVRIDIDNAWNSPIQQYRLNWTTVKSILKIDPPPILKPLSLKTLSLKEIIQ